MNGHSHTSRPSTRRAVEPLESRRFLSAPFTTVDNVPPPAGGYGYIDAMAADPQGNVYACGYTGTTGLLREKAAGSNTFVTQTTPAAGEFTSVGADAFGDVFITDGAHIFERAVGQATFAPVNVNVPAGSIVNLYAYQSFAGDSAGNVFAIAQVQVPTGTTTTGHGANQKTVTTYATYGELLKMAAGQTSFSTVYQSTTFGPGAIAVIDTGPSAGIYVIDSTSSGWLVRRSADGGATWTTSGTYKYDPNLSVWDTNAYAIAADSTGTGNVYVVGFATKREQTGTKYVKVKGQLVAQPVYAYYDHWLTRQSTDGGASWTTVDDYQQAPTASNTAYAVADLGGVVYVAGAGNDGIVRSNVDGGWQTVDTYPPDTMGAVAIDPTTGAAYAGAYDSWVIRSNAAPVAPRAATFSSLAIDQRPADDILGS